ncbi:MAG: copper chaperone PCu(A)C [Deltaproteobacteria bacterium]|nr:copper chaperone PCu(A)C [Deltaproteobacteria bacterium]
MNNINQFEKSLSKAILMIVALLGLLLTAVTTGNTFASEDTHMGEIHVMDAWVRAVPGNAPATAAFMTIGNMGKMDDALVKAETSLGKRVELHLSQMKNGMMEMNQVAEIALPKGGHAELKPGGYHVMIMGLTGPTKPGTEVEIKLTFRHAPPVTIKAVIKEGKPMEGKMGGGMQHNH